METTLPFNLLLMDCFADINVSQGSVVYNICKVQWDFKYPFNCKFQKESSNGRKLNRLRFDRIVIMSLWPRFLAHPV